MPKRKGVRNRGKNEDEKAKKKKKTTPSKCIEPPASISEDENSIGSVEDMMTQDDECNGVTVEEGGANFLTRLDLLVYQYINDVRGIWDPVECLNLNSLY